jgi:hypothetical protein
MAIYNNEKDPNITTWENKQKKKYNRKQAAINKLWSSLRLMDAARLSVLKLNEKGKQFDYVSDPRLSDVIDRINKVSKALDAIVYQNANSY